MHNNRHSVFGVENGDEEFKSQVVNWLCFDERLKVENGIDTGNIKKRIQQVSRSRNVDEKINITQENRIRRMVFFYFLL